jgi:hypothetical protein
VSNRTTSVANSDRHCVIWHFESITFPIFLMRFHSNNALFLSVAFHDFWSQQWQMRGVKFSVPPT